MQLIGAVSFIYLPVVFTLACLQLSTAALRNLIFVKAGTELLEQLHAHLSSWGRECAKDSHGTYSEKIFTHF